MLATRSQAGSHAEISELGSSETLGKRIFGNLERCPDSLFAFLKSLTIQLIKIVCVCVDMVIL